ncbi:MAG: cobalt transporter CbiM [Burkholderiales bacterium]|nr:cobalt transporter CbiM [Burkholderiales bacterium]MBP9768488.1 cobalt transporter CbiM [Burkholderiales bacterium]
MHLPDGYLSPETTLPALAIMFVVWYSAFKKIQLIHNQALIPSIALCAAFSFILMMFNIPVVGGSSAHAVGAVLVAILVGPWAAVLAVSTTLIIQAFLFGDGGILAIGMNCLNMAVIMPFSGYAIYRLISGKATLGSKRNSVAVFIAAYIGINLAALAAGIEMGIQPLLFKAANGAPLYGFYSLAVAVPAMLFAHSLFAGPLEGVISVLALGYVVKFAPHLVVREAQRNIDNLNTQGWLAKNKAVLWVLFGAVILSPLGLLTSGTAYGEWAPEEVKQLIGYIPAGMAQHADKWHALMPDYSLPKFGAGFMSQSMGYVLSALVGILVISALILLSAKLTRRLEKRN